MGTGGTRTPCVFYFLLGPIREKTKRKMTDKLSPSKEGTGSSVFRPALAGRAVLGSKKTKIKLNEAT